MQLLLPALPLGAHLFHFPAALLSTNHGLFAVPNSMNGPEQTTGDTELIFIHPEQVTQNF